MTNCITVSRWSSNSCIISFSKIISVIVILLTAISNLLYTSHHPTSLESIKSNAISCVKGINHMCRKICITYHYVQQWDAFTGETTLLYVRALVWCSQIYYLFLLFMSQKEILIDKPNPIKIIYGSKICTERSGKVFT